MTASLRFEPARRTGVRAIWLLATGLGALAGVSVRAAATSPPADAVPATTLAPEAKSGGIKLGLPSVGVPATGADQPIELNETAPAGGAETSGNEWVVAPVPFINPLFGYGLAGGAAYIYHPPGVDPSLPSWTTGIGGFYSENNSWAVAVGHKMNLQNDTWRLVGLAGYGQVNYDFYGIGPTGSTQAVSLAQTVQGGTAEGLYRVMDHLYAGLSFTFSQVDTKFAGFSVPPWISEITSRGQLSAQMFIPSLRVQWDSRDSSFLPTRGWLVDGDFSFSDERFGSAFTYQAVAISAKHYWALSDHQTIAIYGYGRFAFGDVPFFSLSMIGAKGNLRGYAVGRYQDLMALTAQIEYRWQVWRRFGVVAFTGVGAVAPDFHGFADADKLPSVGGGIRYLLTEKNKLNFRVDVAWGREDRLVYLGVGEAF